jgi:hypothetical protein
MKTNAGLVAVVLAVGGALPAAELRASGSGPVMTQILGTALDYRKPPLASAEIEQALTDLASQGFSLNWDAAPAPWTVGLLEHQEQLQYCREMAARLVRHGMGTVFVFPWNNLLPRDPATTDPAWFGETLNPETGTFTADREHPSWNFGSAAATAAFAARCRALFKAVGFYHMFLSDEQILASPGGNEPHVNRMSTYWTSPTYSKAALGSPTAPGSFRHYLAAAGYPEAATARFPVTTVAVPPGPTANMGLPAVPLNDGNADRLQADNGWPDSALWQHWYGWRTDIYKEWIDALTTAAYEIWGGQPGWLGCAVAAPYYWYDKALGLDVNKIASVPHVDYVVAGYFSGVNFQAVRDAALRHGKKWGGMVELSHYGVQEGVAPQAIIDTFKANVEAGADIMVAYAGANFRSDRPTPNDKGAYLMPAQVAAWGECIRWLEQGRGLRRVVPKP